MSRFMCLQVVKHNEELKDLEITASGTEWKSITPAEKKYYKKLYSDAQKKGYKLLNLDDGWDIVFWAFEAYASENGIFTPNWEAFEDCPDVGLLDLLTMFMSDVQELDETCDEVDVEKTWENLMGYVSPDLLDEGEWDEVLITKKYKSVGWDEIYKLIEFIMDPAHRDGHTPTYELSIPNAIGGEALFEVHRLRYHLITVETTMTQA